MKTLLISTFSLPTPPETYGGAEWIVANHAKGLASLGDDVTLVAAMGSKAPPGVKLIETIPPSHTSDEQQPFLMYDRTLHEYDVIGDHSWFKWSYMAGEHYPVVGTMHGPNMFQRPPPKKYACLTGVSREHSRAASKRLGIPVRTAWNCVDISAYPFTKQKGSGFLSLNRIGPEKGIHKFLEFMAKAGQAGDIVGDDRLMVGKDYVKNIKDSCQRIPNLTFHGLVSNERKLELIQKSRAVVLLPQMPYMEIFGIAAVEAMACGKPIICTPNCGLKDLVVNEETGFFVETAEQFKQVVGLLDTISPEACRKRAEKFDVPIRTKMYRELLKSVADGNRW